MRNIGLDCLRSVAIIIVLINHALIGFFYTTSIVEVRGWFFSFSASSVIAIEWLFVLSGYLIGAMMIRSFENNKNWLKGARDFWLRRWFRTLPNYYLFFTVNLALVFMGITNDGYNYSPLWFSQNLAWKEENKNFFGEAWSLALDEWFYLIMPVLIGIFSYFLKKKKNIFIITSIFLIIFPTFGRILSSVPIDFFQWDEQIRRITIYHLDATGWGVLASVVNRWMPDWWQSKVTTKAALGVLCMLVGLFFVIGLVHPAYMNYAMYTFGNIFSITLMSIGTLLLLPWLTRINFSFRFGRWLIFKLSEYSYSIYLLHFPLLFVFKHFLKIDSSSSWWFLSFVIFLWFFMVFYLSGLVYRNFEKPFADFRNLFTKRVDASPF